MLFMAPAEADALPGSSHMHALSIDDCRTKLPSEAIDESHTTAPTKNYKAANFAQFARGAIRSPALRGASGAMGAAPSPFTDH